MNKQIELDGVTIPYFVTEAGVEYYPIKYIGEQFLMKVILNAAKREDLKQYIKRCVIDYTFKGTTPQETYCMTKEGFRIMCKTFKQRKSDPLQMKRHNIFCNFVGATESMIDENCTLEINEYLKDCIKEFESNNENIIYQTCSKCKNSFPLHDNFFTKVSAMKNGYCKQCRICTGVTSGFLSDNKLKTNIYFKFGLDGYLLYKNNLYEFYIRYCHNSDFKLVASKEEYLDIIKKSLHNKIITNDNLKYSLIINIFNFTFNTATKLYLNNKRLNEYCSGNECKSKPWLYKHYKANITNLDDAIAVFGAYIKSNNIPIDDILKYNNYEKLIDKSRIGTIVFGRRTRNISSLEFIVKYYDNKYPGYKFKLTSVNYYKKKENCIFDMKYLIEKDFKIDIAKIPLYITKYSLSKNAQQLYTTMRGNGYYSDLFTWINDCYPNMFIEADFNINPFRSEFDSLEEAQVDEQLKMKLNNVIYNPRTADNSINIYGMIPDWISITNKGCYLVEYFGMYTDNPGISTISYKYKNKTDKKIEKYIELEKFGYKHLFIFPNDIKNNFEGLHRKLDLIIE